MLTTQRRTQIEDVKTTDDYSRMLQTLHMSVHDASLMISDHLLNTILSGVRGVLTSCCISTEPTDPSHQTPQPDVTTTRGTLRCVHGNSACAIQMKSSTQRLLIIPWRHSRAVSRIVKLTLKCWPSDWRTSIKQSGYRLVIRDTSLRFQSKST